jgi:hypothetical protein
LRLCGRYKLTPRIAQPNMNRPLAAIQLPATRTAIRAHVARTDVTCPARSDLTTKREAATDRTPRDCQFFLMNTPPSLRNFKNGGLRGISLRVLGTNVRKSSLMLLFQGGAPFTSPAQTLRASCPPVSVFVSSISNMFPKIFAFKRP